MISTLNLVLHHPQQPIFFATCANHSDEPPKGQNESSRGFSHFGSLISIAHESVKEIALDVIR